VTRLIAIEPHPDPVDHIAKRTPVRTRPSRRWTPGRYLLERTMQMQRPGTSTLTRSAYGAARRARFCWYWRFS